MQATIILLVCAVVALALFITNLLFARQISSNVEQHQSDKAISIARMTARSPIVLEAFSGQRDKRDIQTFANDMRLLTHVQFIVVMDMNAIRLSHPDPDKVGKHFVGGDETEALKGNEHISVARGTLGMSLRAFTPIFSPQGEQLGAVAVGISLDNVQQEIKQSREILYAGIGLGGLAGLAGALFLARKIKKILFGLEPFEIAKLLQERSAMLQSTREGILAVDENARITLVNAEAIRLLKRSGMDDDPIGKPVEEWLPSVRLKNVLETGNADYDREQNLHGISLLINSVPVRVGGSIVGAVATFRDKTEIRQLAEQLTGVRLYTEALRAQAHEFMNKLHVILGMVHMGNFSELSAYISQIVKQHQTEAGVIARKIRDPVLAGFILGKLSYAREMGVELTISGEGNLPEPENPEVTRELVTILGNLVDNALEAVQGCPSKRVDVNLNYGNGILAVKVSDTGPGISEELKNKIFAKGFSTKGPRRGLGLFLAQRSLERLGGKMDIFSEKGTGARFEVRLPYPSKGETP